MRGSDGFDVAEQETPFARVVARCGEWLQASSDHAGPALLWVKSRGVPTPWVPPQTFAELYLAEFGLAAESEDDQEPVEEIEGAAEGATATEDDLPPAERDSSLDWRYAAAMYAAHVTLVDRWLGKLLATLQKTPGWESALLIVTAGAGEPLGEHAPLGDEKLLLRSESVQTPLWIRVPGSDQACTRRQELVLSVDVAPTLLEWFHEDESGSIAKPSQSAAIAGRSLLPLVANQRVVPRGFVVLGNGSSEWGIRTPKFFYVEPAFAAQPEDRERESELPAALLFEKPHDRWDQSDVLSQYPDIAQELHARLHREIKELTGRSANLMKNGK